MSYPVSTVKRTTPNAYKTLLDQLQTENGQLAALEKIAEICKACHPISPLMCVELCEIWPLKQTHHDILHKLQHTPTTPTLLNLIKNRQRLIILQRLMDYPQTVTEIRIHLKTRGYYHSVSTLYTTYLQPLVDGGLVREKHGTYHITGLGQSMYTIFSTSDLIALPPRSNGYEEQVLLALKSASQTPIDLAKHVPRYALPRTLHRLWTRHFIERESRSGRVFYYATKRRATRKMTSMEAKIFNALTKDALSPQEISATVGITVRTVYKYLRRLQYKFHVTKEPKQHSYTLTKKGQRLARALTIANNLSSPVHQTLASQNACLYKGTP